MCTRWMYVQVTVEYLTRLPNKIHPSAPACKHYMAGLIYNSCLNGFVRKPVRPGCGAKGPEIGIFCPWLVPSCGEYDTGGPYVVLELARGLSTTGFCLTLHGSLPMLPT
jgi:hypothetical protein